MSKKMMILFVVLGCALFLALCGAMILNWIGFSRLADAGSSLSRLEGSVTELQGSLSGVQDGLSTLHDDITVQEDTPEDLNQENDVTIAGDYVIRSTEPISDAYRSGDRSALTDKEKEVLDMASDILGQIVTDDMTDFEKEKAVYEWMIRNLTHDSGLLTVIPTTQADCDNPYGVLKYHNAVCVGYATTFRLFMQMMGIPCKVVHNSDCYHSWDLVQLDGGWYHTDIYSDVGTTNYSHFNLTDVMMASNQSWDTDFFPPADRTAYCYACMNAVKEEDIYHVPTALREALDNGADLLALQFDKSLQEYQAQIVQQMLANVQDRLSYSSSYEMNFDWSWVPVDAGYVLSVNINWYNQEEPTDPEIPEDAYEKMDEAVDSAFGDIAYNYYDDYSRTDPVG